MMKISLIALSVLLLAACGEKEQTISGSYKPDQKAWQGAGGTYHANGYKGGDKAAWDAQMRQRAQVQNEYVRIN